MNGARAAAPDLLPLELAVVSIQDADHAYLRIALAVLCHAAVRDVVAINPGLALEGRS